jgi:hypothetical protein
VVALCTLARGQGLLGSGALLEERAGLGPSVSHAWIVVPGVGGDLGAEVLHLPPRGVLSERDGRVTGARSGEARPATALRTAPVAVAARDSHVAMVFTDPAGFPQANGRTLLTFSAEESTPGVWETMPKGRPDSLPSLRADGLLLGFSGSEAGYCALYQGLTLNNADSTRLVLQLLAGSSWVDVPLPEELEVEAGKWFTFAAGSKPATAISWRLFAAPGGVGLLVMPPGLERGVLGTLWLAKLTPPVGKKPAGAQWTSAEVKLPGDGRLSNVSALSAAGHVVITGLVGVNQSAHQGQMRVFTRPCDFPSLAWREVASVAAVSTDHVVVALDGVGRVAVLSSPVGAADRKDRDKQTLTEVSVGTGAVVYSGELMLTSPMSRGDYRMVAVILGYAVGLVLIFLLRVPPADAILLPEGYSLAEPGRRMVAGVIDIAIGLVIASRLLHMPFSDVISPSAWWSEQGQAVLLTSVAAMIGLNTVLELLFARSIGKIVTGCQIALVDNVGAGAKKPEQASPSGEVKVEMPRHAGLGRLLLRNLIKYGLPPVALLGLLDASGRHRGDQLAQTAVIIEGVDDQDEEQDEEDEDE